MLASLAIPGINRLLSSCSKYTAPSLTASAANTRVSRFCFPENPKITGSYILTTSSAAELIPQASTTIPAIPLQADTAGGKEKEGKEKDRQKGGKGGGRKKKKRKKGRKGRKNKEKEEKEEGRRGGKGITVRGNEEYWVYVSLGSSLHSQEGGTEERGELESVFSCS